MCSIIFWHYAAFFRFGVTTFLLLLFGHHRRHNPVHARYDRLLTTIGSGKIRPQITHTLTMLNELLFLLDALTNRVRTDIQLSQTFDFFTAGNEGCIQTFTTINLANTQTVTALVHAQQIHRRYRTTVVIPKKTRWKVKRPLTLKT